MVNKEEENLLSEIREVISDGQNEISEEKKIAYDKTTQQYSIKIPKSLALKANLKENSILNIIVNPKESKEKINNAKFIIYLKEVDDGKGKKTT